MSERIEIKGDNWVFGEDFFIQAALFEKTGYADWVVEKLGAGPRDNQTDGEIDGSFWAWRKGSYGIVNGEYVVHDVELISEFRINASGYSYQSVYEEALKNIPEVKDIDLSSDNCKDDGAIPTILKEKYLGG